MRRTLVGMAIVSLALMVPFLVRADDQKIAQAIVTQIQEHMDAGRLKGFGIDLQVDKGIVELKGEVATAEQLDLILAAVAQADGVRDVINEVTLKDGTVAAPKAEVKEAGTRKLLAKDPLTTLEEGLFKPADKAIRNFEKQVSSVLAPASTGDASPAARVVTGDAENNRTYVRMKDLEKKPAARVVTEAGEESRATFDPIGKITERLSGAQKKIESVLSPSSKADEKKTPAAAVIRAGDTTRLEKGENVLESIQGQVAGTLESPQGPSDQQIANELSKVLYARKEAGLLKGFGLKLRVREGNIWLSGRVSSEHDRQMIDELAQATYGVKQVVNELELGGAEKQSVRTAIADTAPQQLPAVTDNQIAMMISGKLKAKKEDGSLTNFSLQMTVKDGKVWLQGYVPSRKQRDMALATASGIEGVTDVVNEIDIQLPITRDVNAMLPPALRSQGQQTGMQQMAQMAQVPVAMAAGALAVPAQMASSPAGVSRARYEQPQVPNYAWPTYAAHPNYAAVTYPKQYSPSAWPYIGPFYPYPQVPLGWRKVTLEWDDGWWFLDFSSRR